jgi:hypothetical protein
MFVCLCLQGDNGGWQYSMDFASTTWREEQGMGSESATAAATTTTTTATCTYRTTYPCRVTLTFPLLLLCRDSTAMSERGHDTVLIHAACVCGDYCVCCEVYVRRRLWTREVANEMMEQQVPA